MNAITSSLRRDRETKRTTGTGVRGGARPGAGRPPSAALSSRMLVKHLNMNDARFARQELIAAIQGSDQDPLLILLEIASDRAKSDEIRVQAAAVAVRHVHPTLQQSQLQLVHQKADQGRVLDLLHERLDRLNPSSAPTLDGQPEAAQEPAEAQGEAVVKLPEPE